MNTELINKIKAIFEENGLPVYEDDLNEEIEYDSIQFVSIIADIEAAFSIQFPEEILSSEELNTVRDFYDITAKLL